jgi:hypothetical protein
VAYPNGQMVDYELAGLPLPLELTGLSPARTRDSDVLHETDLEKGREYLTVRYGPSQLEPNDRSHYSTTLTNISAKQIKVLKFAGYTRMGKEWRLSTVTGTFYSGQEFREWYGLGRKQSIGPGETATDPEQLRRLAGTLGLLLRNRGRRTVYRRRHSELKHKTKLAKQWPHRGQWENRSQLVGGATYGRKTEAFIIFSIWAK